MGYADPTRSGTRGWFMYFLILLISCIVIGSVIGWGADLLRLAPFAALGLIIASNNLIASAAISTLLLSLLFSRVGSWGLLYYQILDDESVEFNEESIATSLQVQSVKDPSKPSSKLSYIGALLCIIGAVTAFLSGLLISGQALHAGYGTVAFASGSAGTFAVGVGMLPGLLLLFVGAALL